MSGTRWVRHRLVGKVIAPWRRMTVRLWRDRDGDTCFASRFWSNDGDASVGRQIETMDEASAAIFRAATSNNLVERQVRRKG